MGVRGAQNKYCVGLEHPLLEAAELKQFGHPLLGIPETDNNRLGSWARYGQENAYLS